MKGYLYFFALHLFLKFVLNEAIFQIYSHTVMHLVYACILIEVGLYYMHSFIQRILEIFLGKGKSPL